MHLCEKNQQAYEEAKKKSAGTIKTTDERDAGLHAMLIGVVRLAQKN